MHFDYNYRKNIKYKSTEVLVSLPLPKQSLIRPERFIFYWSTIRVMKKNTSLKLSTHVYSYMVVCNLHINYNLVLYVVAYVYMGVLFEIVRASGCIDSGELTKFTQYAFIERVINNIKMERIVLSILYYYYYISRLSNIRIVTPSNVHTCFVICYS